MLRPERMTSVSIICLRKTIDHALEILNDFGEFHIEPSAQLETISEYNQTARKTEEALTDVNDLIRKFSIEQVGFRDFFRSKPPTKMQVKAENWQSLAKILGEQVQNLKNETKILDASLASAQEETSQFLRARNTLEIMEAIGVDLSVTEGLRLVNITVASLPSNQLRNLKLALNVHPSILHACRLEKETSFICIATPAKYTEEVTKAMKTYHGEIFRFPDYLPRNLPVALRQINERINQSTVKEKRLKDQLTNLGKSNAQRLLSFREASQNILVFLRAQMKILQSGRLATIKGFVPKKKLNFFRRRITKSLSKAVLVIEESTEPSADPPTRFTNNRFVKPFEEITKLYGVPHYDELDPTPIIAITFPLIFALMFGDVGHGIVLLLGGLTVWFLLKKDSPIKNICWILAACGAGAIIAGLLFGEFFGLNLFSPLWFSPFDNVQTFLIFSLFIGVLQITSGLVLDLINYALKGDTLNVFLTSVPKIAFYIGSVYLIAVYQLNFTAWMQGPVLLAIIPLLLFALGRPAVERLKLGKRESGYATKSMSLTERFFESGDLVTRLLSNTVSYTRILALLMAHWALITVTYVVAGFVGTTSTVGLVISVIVVIFGNLFVIALEGLIVFIHSLRLHFYEWFSKFYSGSGTEFSPYKQNFVYTEIVLSEKPSS